MHGLMNILWIWIIGALTLTGCYCHAQKYEDVTPADLFVCFFLWPLVLVLIIACLMSKVEERVRNHWRRNRPK